MSLTEARAVLGEAVWPVIGGAAVGAPAAIVAGRLLSARLFGVAPLDPRTLVLAVAALVLVAAVAAFVPARRVSQVDPLLALRCE
jgi:ABC-type antimicrobial peptide transport system permease subunit